MSRHYHDAGYIPMFDGRQLVIDEFHGVRAESEVHFEGGSAALPGIRFTTVAEPTNDD